MVHRPDLIGKSFKELYDGLPQEHKDGVDRIRWCFDKKLPTIQGIDMKAVLDFELTADDLRLLYDPLLPPELEATLSEEDKILALASMDTPMFVRTFFNYEPRTYQLMMMRSPDRIRSFRLGRRAGKSTTMVWEALSFAYTNPNVRVIIIAPLEAQVKLIWDMVDDCLLHTGVKPLKNAIASFGITSKIRKPWEIHFTNGSKIKAFTSGARSGGKADSVRGNEAHMIIVDEMDLMMPDDLNAITAMMQKTSAEFSGEKRLIVSSTPNGRRDMFYAFSRKNTVKEFWFPSFANPFFGPADEIEQKDLLTETGFIHEIVADWGSSSTGVFKPSIFEHVAKEEYSYWMERRNCGPIICGVDWDKYGAGVNIVIVANVDGILTTIYREEIERSKYEHTLGAGIDKIIELDKKFKFAYVYCDRGYGERQWEELVEKMPYGDTRVLGKNFSSSVLETNPVTGATDKEEFKPFMVDNAVNLYEKKKVRLNPDDEKFTAQLLGYVQVRMSATGRPVFGSMDPERIGDHALDAWMLALLGHTEKYGDIIIPFEHISPRTVNTNSALAPGGSKEERDETVKRLTIKAKPMSFTSRKRASGVFNRPSF